MSVMLENIYVLDATDTVLGQAELTSIDKLPTVTIAEKGIAVAFSIGRIGPLRLRSEFAVNPGDTISLSLNSGMLLSAIDFA